MNYINTKNMTAAIALASVLGLNAFSATAETQPAAKPAAPAAQPAAAKSPAQAAPAAAQAAAPAKSAAEAPVVAAEPAAAPEVAPDAAAAPVEDAPAAAADAAPEAVPAPAAKAVEAPAPAKPAATSANSDAATGSAAHKVSLGSVVVGADGKEVGTVNRVRTEASGNVTEIHIQTSKAGVISVPGNKIASGGQNVKLSLTADEVSKMPAVGGGKS